MYTSLWINDDYYIIFLYALLYYYIIEIFIYSFFTNKMYNFLKKFIQKLNIYFKQINEAKIEN